MVVSHFENLAVVLDEYIPEEYISEMYEEANKGEEYLTYVQKVETGEKNTKQGTGLFAKPHVSKYMNYTDFIIHSPILNLKGSCEYSAVTKIHRMEQGGQIVPHNDGAYTYAVTTYLNECEGGVLVLEHPISGELFKVQPKKNRTIIMDTGIRHWVEEVISGERKSLQTFITIERLVDEPLTPKE